MTTETRVNRRLGDTAAQPQPPTSEEISARKRAATLHFDAFHKQCALYEEYYFLNRKIPVPEDSDPVRPATARAIIDVATDHVDVNNITIEVPIMLRSKARAEKLQKFYQGVWTNIKGPVLRTAVKHSFMYGIAWLAPRFLAQLWYDAPKMEDFGVRLEDGNVMMVDEAGYKEALKDFMDRRKLIFPFSLENVNPREMLWDDSKTGPKWAIRTVSATVQEMRERYPDWMTTKGLGEMVEWVEYWDDTWYAYLADGVFVRTPTRHGYGFLPFVPVISANTLDWDSDKPERRYQGMLHPVMNLLDSEARIVSQIHAIMHSVSYRTLDFTGPTHLANQARESYQLFGGKNIIPAGVAVDASPFIQVPPDLLNNLSSVQTMIEEATFPNVVRGQRPTGVGSGFHTSVLAGMGRLRFQGVADGMSRAIEQLNTMWGKLLENSLRSPLTVHARSEIHSFDETIKPEDVKGYYENMVRLKAEAPEEREREAILATQLWNNGEGGISLYEYQRRIGIVNPLREQLQMAAERLVAGTRDQQLIEFQQAIASNQASQLQQAGAGVRGDLNTRFQPGQSQLQRPGEANIQQARVASQQNQPSVFPRNQGGIDILGSLLGAAPGGAQGVPSGQTIRR
jgi:hypothetical protein